MRAGLKRGYFPARSAGPPQPPCAPGVRILHPRESAVAGYAFAVLGMNLSATPLLHQRWPVGGGPSSKMCP